MNQTQFLVQGKQHQTNQDKTFSFSSANIIKTKMKQIWKSSKNQTFSTGLTHHYLHSEKLQSQKKPQNSLNNSFSQMFQKCEKNNAKDLQASTDVTCLCNGSKDIIIQELEGKLEKKNELIRYLERKRGQKILVSLNKFEKKIAELQEENRFLKQFAFDSFNREKQSQIENISICGETQPQQKTSQNGFEIQFKNKFQKQIKSCEKIISDFKKQCGQQRSFQTVPNIVGKCHQSQKKDSKINRTKSCIFPSSFELLIQNLNLSNASGKAEQVKNKTSRVTTCSSMKSKSLDFGTQTETESLLNHLDTQTEQTYKDLQNKQSYRMELESNTISLNKLVEEMQVQNQQLRQQMIQLYEKVGHYHRDLLAQNSQSIQSISYHKLKQVSKNYNQILDIFGIEVSNEDSCPKYNEYHQQLLAEILEMKSQIISLLGQYKKLQKELYSSKNKSKNKQKVEIEGEKICKLEGMIESLSEIIECNNREIVGLKLEQINRKLRECCDSVVLEKQSK